MSLPQPVANPRYDEWFGGDGYLKAHPTWFVHEAPWKANLVLQMLNRNGLEPRTIIDVGCGAGRVLAEMQPRLHPDCVLQGYDVAPAAISIAKGCENDRLHFAVADVTSMTDLNAELMLVLDVIDHIEDPFAFLRAIKPLSRSKILHISLDLSVQRAMRRDGLMSRRRQGVVHFFTKELALELLRDTGYEIKDYFYTGMALDLNDARGRLQDGNRNQPPIHWRNFVLRGPRRALFRVNQDVAVRLLGGYYLMVLVE